MPIERDHATKADRALGALLGVAIGDAMGMPTQSMSSNGNHFELRAGNRLLRRHGKPADFGGPACRDDYR